MCNPSFLSNFVADKARMAELADASVSNTDGATLTGSIPVPGTPAGNAFSVSRLFYFIAHGKENDLGYAPRFR